MCDVLLGATDVISRTRRIAGEIAAPAAGSVDREARFPEEAYSALRQEKLLGAAIPRELGGLGCSIPEVAGMCTALGESCASSALIFAMHQIQVFCLVRHAAESSYFSQYLRDAAEEQWLIASATSEVGTGGDMRSSIAAIESDGPRFRLKKKCTTISYGLQADAILVTARRAPDATPGEQVIALVTRQDYDLEDVGCWDSLGMRGTCSPSMTLKAEAPCEQIVAEPFRSIAAQTMVPYSHVVWSSAWLGIATDAVAIARSYLRESARKEAGKLPFGSARMVDLLGKLDVARAYVNEAAQEYARLIEQPEGQSALTGMSYSLRMNTLKVACSQLVSEICLGCLEVCGIAGYLNGSRFSLGRHVRDALAAPLMIANDRIRATNASLMLVTSQQRE